MKARTGSFLLLALAPLASLARGAQDDESSLTSRQVGAHAAPITHLVVGSGGKVLYTATGEGMIRAWRLGKEKLLWERRPKGMPPAVNVPLSGFDVGDEMLAYSTVLIAHAMDLATGEEEPAIGGVSLTQKCNALACDPKDRWIWLGTDQGVMVRVTPGNVRGWSSRPMKNGGVLCLAMDRAAKLLAVGGEDGTIRFLNPTSANRDEKKVFDEPAPVTALAFDKKAANLASGSRDGRVRLWAVRKGACRQVLEGHEAPIRSLAWGPKGRVVASGDESGVIRLWDVKTGEVLATPSTAGEGAVAGLAFVDKGKALIGTTGGEQVLLWDLSEL